jgi:hypothetical protein
VSCKEIDEPWNKGCHNWRIKQILACVHSKVKAKDVREDVIRSMEMRSRSYLQNLAAELLETAGKCSTR